MFQTARIRFTLLAQCNENRLVAKLIFVEGQLERKLQNYIVKMTRLYRKVYNNYFNYFCTFTYDDKKHSEEIFMKSLKNCKNFKLKYQIK